MEIIAPILTSVPEPSVKKRGRKRKAKEEEVAAPPPPPLEEDEYDDTDQQVKFWLETYPVISNNPDECTRLEQLKPKQRAILERAHSNMTKEVVLDELLPILRQEGKISLRLLEWLVTNYVKRHPVSYVLRADDMFQFDVFRDYSVQLRAYHKKNFDFFRRGPRVVIKFGDVCMLTTPGQINCLWWARENKVLQYGEQHAAELLDDIASSKHGKSEPVAVEKPVVVAPPAEGEYRLVVKLKFCRFNAKEAVAA